MRVLVIQKLDFIFLTGPATQYQRDNTFLVFRSGKT